MRSDMSAIISNSYLADSSRLADAQNLLDRFTSTFYSLDSLRGQKLVDQFLHPPAKLNFALHGRGVYFVSNQCNLNCVYCKGLESSIVPPALDEFEQVVRGWSERQLHYLHLTGLEPTVSPCLLEYLKIAEKYHLGVSMSTNGYLEFRRYREFVRHGLKYLSISLDAHNNKLTRQLSQRDDIYDRVSANIRQFMALKQEYDLKIVICLTVTKVNFPLLPEIVADFLEKLQPDDIRLIPAAQERFSADERAQYDGVIRPQLLRLASPRYPFLRFRIEHFFDTRGLRPSSARRCYVALDERTVGGQQLYPCNIYIRERGRPIAAATDPEQNIKIWRWFLDHDSLADPICANYCCDVTREYNRMVDAHLQTLADRQAFQPPRLLENILQEAPIRQIFEELQGDSLETHLKRTALNAGMLGMRLRWHDLTLYYLIRAALLHDIGKSHHAIRRVSLLPIASQQKHLLRQHTEFGKERLLRLGYAMEAEIAYLHHDRPDSAGYHHIPLEWPMAEVVALADVYSALTEDRNHRPKMAAAEAISIILSGGCGAFREPYLRALQACHEHRCLC